MYQLEVGNSYQKVDPFKIKTVISNALHVKKGNDQIREKINTVGAVLGQLSKSTAQLNGSFVDTIMEKHLKEINTNLVKLYSLFNGINEFVFSNDSSCNEIAITCKNTLSAESHLMTMEQLKNKYAELQKTHAMVKQQLFD